MSYRVIAPFLIFAVITYFLFTGIGLSYYATKIVSQQITIELIAPVDYSIDLFEGTLKIKTLAAIENDASSQIEVESGSYEVYLELDLERYKIVKGIIEPTLIGPHSRKVIPIEFTVSLKSLPKIFSQILSGNLPEVLSKYLSAKDISLIVKVTLTVPIKFLGMKITTYKVSRIVSKRL